MYTDKAIIDIFTELHVLSTQGRAGESLYLAEMYAVEFLNSLALNYYQLFGDTAKAEKLFNAALEVQPGNWRVYSNISHIMATEDRLEDALSPAYKAAQCLGQEPVCDPIYNLGVILSELGRDAEGVEMYRKALLINPDHALSQYNMGLGLLKMKQYEGGWKWFECRFKTGEKATAFRERFSQPEWDGRAAKKKSICVYSEQGLGDFIQFVRFLPRLKKYFRKVVVEVQDPMADLMGPHLGFDALLTRTNDANVPPAPKTDFCVSVNSLAGLLGVRGDGDIPGEPYLFAPKGVRQGFPKKKLKVGIAWSGNADHTKDRTRSLVLEWLRPLGDVPNIQIYSLQKFSLPVRRWGKQLVNVDMGRENFPMTDLAPEIENFGDVARLINQLDLVVTVDSGLAHLAGAMGKPVWTLLSQRNDWRWGQSGESTAWYPSMRLFRQPSYGDWKSVIDKVVTELSSLQTSRCR